MKIGVCGTGRMGSAIAQRLMSVGHEVGVWNRNPAKTSALVDAGAKPFASPAELVEGCEVTIMMLLNDAATEAVYRAPNGILKAKLAGKLVDRYEHGSPGHDEIERFRRVAAGRRVCRMPGRRKHRPREGRQAARPGRRVKGRCRAGDADPGTIVPPHRTCRRTRRGLDDETCGQPAAAGVLAGARRSLDDLQAAQSSRRPADRHPDRHVGRADRHEGPRPRYRQGTWAERRWAKPRSASMPRKRISPARSNSAASLHAELPVTASALACYEEAEAAGLGDADATAISTRWAQRKEHIVVTINLPHAPNNQPQQQSQFK